MSFRTRFTSLSNLMFSCSRFSKELSEQSQDSDFSVPCELPDSVIHEILMKLPIKSVIRCRRVCKAWYQLILDPYFADVYFKRSPFNVTAISQHLTYHESDWRLKFPEYSFQYVEIGRNDNSLNVKAFDSPEQKALVGSCDGLLCLVEVTPVVQTFIYSRAISCNNPTRSCDGWLCCVWIVNPLIGAYRALPRFRGYSSTYVVYGFGSTIDGDHYKVIKVAMNFRHTPEAHILTVGVDKYWREVDVSKMPLRFYSHGVILNGILHWLGDVDTPHGVIYAFDIQKEKGQCFNLPRAVGRIRYEIYLVVRNGHLCITDSSNKRQVDIWTMKQYGEVESWSREVIIFPNNIFRIPLRVLIPITTMKNGHLLLSCQNLNALFSWDPKTRSVVEFKEIRASRSWLASGYGYSPSFISPHDLIRYKYDIIDKVLPLQVEKRICVIPNKKDDCY